MKSCLGFVLFWFENSPLIRFVLTFDVQCWPDPMELMFGVDLTLWSWQGKLESKNNPTNVWCPADVHDVILLMFMMSSCWCSWCLPACFALSFFRQILVPSCVLAVHVLCSLTLSAPLLVLRNSLSAFTELMYCWLCTQSWCTAGCQRSQSWCTAGCAHRVDVLLAVSVQSWCTDGCAHRVDVLMAVSVHRVDVLMAVHTELMYWWLCLFCCTSKFHLCLSVFCLSH